MRFIAPEVHGGDHIRVAEQQEEYLTVPAMIIKQRHEGPDGQVKDVSAHLLCVEFNLVERLKLAEGDKLYLSLLSFGGPMQPISVVVGKEEVAKAFGLSVGE